MIYDYELESYLNNGWTKGKLKDGDVIIHKGNIRKLIWNYELESYLNNGWTKGQGKTKPKTGRPRKVRINQK